MFAPHQPERKGDSTTTENSGHHSIHRSRGSGAGDIKATDARAKLGVEDLKFHATQHFLDASQKGGEL